MSATPFDFIQDATREHRRRHGCDAYTFKSGAELIAVARRHAPSRILELGTALGFTACCLASSNTSASVDTIESDPEHVRLARDNIESAGLADRITVHQGCFEAVLTTLRGPYDLAFFDGLSPSRSLVERLRTLLTRDGILVCANVRLANDREQRALEAEFGDASRWRTIGAIENGGTRLFRKAVPGSTALDADAGGEAVHFP